jgi:acetyl-CoA carboxylase carboxyl transferase subunit alpha
MTTILPHELPIHEMEQTLAKLLEQNSKSGLWSSNEIEQMERKLLDLKKNVYSQLKPWEKVQICRHPQRPHALDFINAIADDFIELFGDRCVQDDHAIVGGLGKINGIPFLLIGQEKGHDTENRLFRNFGMPHPEGYRKALRLMKLAERFGLPVVTFVDTPGAFPGLTAEERGQGWAIAQNLLEMARLKTPIISVIIGEGCSGGALGIAVADRIGILEYAYYSVISPEGCASILWDDASKNAVAASALKMHAQDLLELSVVDEMISEPLGGAHRNPAQMIQEVKTFVLKSYGEISAKNTETLLEERYQKFRNIGCVELVDSI